MQLHIESVYRTAHFVLAHRTAHGNVMPATDWREAVAPRSTDGIDLDGLDNFADDDFDLSAIQPNFDDVFLSRNAVLRCTVRSVHETQSTER